MLIKIAVIDDGINQNGYALALPEHDIEIADDQKIMQRIGYDRALPSHGTTCAAIIKKYAPDARLSSIKVMGDNHCGVKENLITALKWCMDNDIELISMSIGTTYYQDEEIVKAQVQQVTDKGIIIVAAANNKNVITFPASFANVIGVKSDLSKSLKEGEYIFNTFAPDGIQITSCAAHPLERTDGTIQTTPSSNSFAAPMITGLVCNIMEAHAGITIEGILERLQKNALKKEAEPYSLLKSIYSSLKRDVPIIVYCDRIEARLREVMPALSDRFREDGYHAVAVMCGGSPLKGVVQHQDFVGNTKESFYEVIERIYAIYDPDLLLLGVDSHSQIEELEKHVALDIKITEDEVALEVMMNSGGESRFVLLSSKPEKLGSKGVVYVDIEAEGLDERLHQCICRLFEEDQ